MRPWATEAGLFPIVVCGCAWLWCASAHAQVSGSVGVVSDYRYRGHSLSEGDPAAQASVGYDAASGAYGGLFASTTKYRGDAGAQWIPYAGYARRDAQGRSWDIGVRYVGFSGDGDYDFAEAHVGLAFDRLALRLHVAPDYYGATENAYLEADLAFPVGERVRLLLHGGFSHSGSSSSPGASYRYEHDGYGYEHTPYADPYASSDRTRFDVSAGVVVTTGVCDVQATWHHLGGGAGYAGPWDPDDRTGFVLGCIKRW